MSNHKKTAAFALAFAAVMLFVEQLVIPIIIFKYRIKFVHQDLNTKQFRDEFGDVMSYLCKTGLWKSRSEMHKICSEKKSLALGESYGFSVETDNHIFLLRCRPERGNYDCYCYCYNKRELQLAQSQEQGETHLPEMSL